MAINDRESSDRGTVRSRVRIVEATIAELRDALDAGVLTSVELVAAYLNRIAYYDRHGIRLNAVPVLNPDLFSDARAAGPRRSQSWARKARRISCSRNRSKALKTQLRNERNWQKNIVRSSTIPITRPAPATWTTSSSRANRARRSSPPCRRCATSTRPLPRASMGISRCKRWTRDDGPYRSISVA